MPAITSWQAESEQLRKRAAAADTVLEKHLNEAKQRYEATIAKVQRVIISPAHRLVGGGHEISIGR